MAATGAQFAMCVGANGTVDDVVSMLSLAADPSHSIAWGEGINEPNTDFGSGAASPRGSPGGPGTGIDRGSREAPQPNKVARSRLES
jgi:hypothetical protein